MSGIHAKIFAGSDGIRIRDLNSLNGTQVNGTRIVESALRAGDQIKIGRATILVTGTPGQGLFDESTQEIPAPTALDLLDKPWSSADHYSAQTVKIHLDELRLDRGQKLQENDYILLLRDADRGDEAGPLEMRAQATRSQNAEGIQ